jgi:hypothetical protein
MRPRRSFIRALDLQISGEVPFQTFAHAAVLEMGQPGMTLLRPAQIWHAGIFVF